MEIDTSKSGWAKWNAKKKEKRLTPTLSLTLKLFQERLSIEDIMTKREFKQDSVERQIIELITRSFIDISDVIDEVTYGNILNALSGEDLSTLKPIKEKLGDEVSWFDIKCVIASLNARAEKLDE